MRSKYIFKAFSLVFSLFFLMSCVFAFTYNSQGDFSVDFDNSQRDVFDDNLSASFSFDVTNRDDFYQRFILTVPSVSGWKVSLEPSEFGIERGETKKVTVNIVGGDVAYSSSVVAPAEVKITKREGYRGNFDFPVKIYGSSESVSLNFALNVLSKDDLKEEFKVVFDGGAISPISPLKYKIIGSDVMDEEEIFVSLDLGGGVFSKVSAVFSPDKNERSFEQSIPSSLKPGVYETKVTIRSVEDGTQAREWYEKFDVEVEEYENLVVSREASSSFVGDVYFIKVFNDGNIGAAFSENISFGFFKSLFFGSDASYMNVENGAFINVELDKGEYREIVYFFNYLPLYLSLLVAGIILGVIFVRRIMNPLDVESKIYGIISGKYDGVQSMKVRVGFENIKNYPLDRIKIIFKMPSYLNVKKSSFLLVEPNKVLKKENEYKLVWEFRNFAENDARILGFTLVNSKGILGDIKLPALEVEVIRGGKKKKYYKNFPIIRS